MDRKSHVSSAICNGLASSLSSSMVKGLNREVDGVVSYLLFKILTAIERGEFGTLTGILLIYSKMNGLASTGDICMSMSHI